MKSSTMITSVICTYKDGVNWLQTQPQCPSWAPDGICCFASGPAPCECTWESSRKLPKIPSIPDCWLPPSPDSFQSPLHYGNLQNEPRDSQSPLSFSFLLSCSSLPSISLSLFNSFKGTLKILKYYKNKKIHNEKI